MSKNAFVYDQYFMNKHILIHMPKHVHNACKLILIRH